MSQENNGGPAFPYSDNGYLKSEDGMSLRDYMAIHSEVSGTDFGSMENLAEFAGVSRDDVPSSDDLERIIKLSAQAIAKLRYINADAMLAEREKEPNT